jgi:hypothetical protein
MLPLLLIVFFNAKLESVSNSDGVGATPSKAIDFFANEA